MHFLTMAKWQMFSFNYIDRRALQLMLLLDIGKRKEAALAMEKADFRFLEGIQIRIFKAKKRQGADDRGKFQLSVPKEVNKEFTVAKVDSRSYKEVVTNISNRGGKIGGIRFEQNEQKWSLKMVQTSNGDEEARRNKAVLEGDITVEEGLNASRQSLFKLGFYKICEGIHLLGSLVMI
ncbi:hypothetical protein COLO4_33439 [Corchorus olitorius]|uniref:Uncharacterized protein n=1 Tax=Corchorus olitorius TaxID=93759 RepID=A0A1R3GTS4_9ROSI|nr:hypothetical protein COLO4_33439 [Corchorus olitorius]